MVKAALPKCLRKWQNLGEVTMFRKGDRVQVVNAFGPPHDRKGHVLDTIYEIVSTAPSPFMRLKPLPVERQFSEEGRVYARCCQNGGRDVHFERLLIYAGEPTQLSLMEDS